MGSQAATSAAKARARKKPPTQPHSAMASIRKPRMNPASSDTSSTAKATQSRGVGKISADMSFTLLEGE